MITSYKEVLDSCPNYEYIINYNISDIYSIKLIEWYKDIALSTDNKDILNIIDKSIYLYITNYNYKKYMKSKLRLHKININNIYLIKDVISLYISYNNKIHVDNTKWI